MNSLVADLLESISNAAFLALLPSSRTARAFVLASRKASSFCNVPGSLSACRGGEREASVVVSVSRESAAVVSVYLQVDGVYERL